MQSSCRLAVRMVGSTGAGRAQTVQSEAGLCCCLHSHTSAVLKAVAGVALQLAPVPVALSIVVGMSNYYILKSVFVTVFERACALQAPSVLFAAEGTGLSSMLVPCLANLRVGTWGMWKCSTWSHCCCSYSLECSSVKHKNCSCPPEILWLRFA